MQESGNFILTIGGFDPCNGAGITQDIKTLEAHGFLALSVMTCLTIQNEDEVRSVRWFALDDIIAQIDILLDRYQVEWLKISLVEDLHSLSIITGHLLKKDPSMKIIWDPVQAASSGFEFNRQSDRKILGEILESIYLTTPNWNEIKNWSLENEEAEETAKRLSGLCNICLKGGHHPQHKALDTLYTTSGQQILIPPIRTSSFSKHGSGCVFASALTANLASGQSLQRSIEAAKEYVVQFIESCDGQLGHHHSNIKTEKEIEI